MKQDTVSDQVGGSHMPWMTWLVTGALFMEILDAAIIAPALPFMAHDFGVTPLALNVGISAYLLAVGVFILTSSSISDRFGTRRIFMSAIVLFTISSALCGVTNDLATFVAIRAVQGVSGALMAPVLGPPLGGFIARHLGWHWIFFMNVPLGAAALVAAYYRKMQEKILSTEVGRRNGAGLGYHF